MTHMTADPEPHPTLRDRGVTTTMTASWIEAPAPAFIY